MKPVSLDLLKKLADMATPKPGKALQQTGQGFDLDAFISRNSIAIKQEKPWSSGQRNLILDHCPFNADHTGTSAAILQFEDGAIVFKCHHNSCAGKSWSDLRELFEPGYQERKQIAVEGGEILQSIRHQHDTRHETAYKNEDLPVSCIAEEETETPSANCFPESAWTGPFANWRDIVSASTEASLESLWAAFVVASGLVIGRRAWRMSPRPLFPNFYILLLGQTGDSRKSTCLWLASEFLRNIGEDTRLLEGVVSAEGLVEALAVRDETKALIYSDEFRALLAVARRKGTMDILPRLNSLYYCPEKSTVDRVKNPTTAIRPFVSLISATPQEYVDDLLCDLDVTGGFLNRFLIVTGDEQAPKPIVRTPSGDQWDRLAMNVQVACDKASGHIEFSPDALERWKVFYVGWRNSRRKLDRRKAQLTARIFEHVLKIATTYAVLTREDAISRRTLDIAIEVGNWIEANTFQLFTTIGMDQFSKCEHTIMDVLNKARNRRMWRRDLQRTIGSRGFNAEIFNRAIRALETNDRVVCYDVSVSSGRTRTVIQYT